MNSDKPSEVRDATIYAFKLLAAAQGKPYSTCVSFTSFPHNSPGKHDGAAIYLSTWIIPLLESATGLSYHEWCDEQEREYVVRTLRSLRNSMAANGG